MQVLKITENKSQEILKEAVNLLLEPHSRPVFGAVKLVEHEVAALRALTLLGEIPSDADDYELVRRLRITKAKARALLYQEVLRKPGDLDDTDQVLKDLLIRPTIALEGNMMLIDVPHPLTMDLLRGKARELGFLSDGSFSGSVARIPVRALGKLVEGIIPSSEHKAAIKHLRSLGIQGNDSQSLIVGLIGFFGKALAGAAGDHLGRELAQGLQALMSSAWDALSKTVGEMPKK